MKNNGAVKGTISTVAGEYTVPQGYHDGSGKVSIDATEQAKLIATNIREGVTILGVEGAMSGSEDMKPQSKEVTPSKEAQTIMPDEEYNCLSQVTVKAIPYVETDNSAGGKTVTEEALLKGYTAHKADGTIITGTAFAGYPNEFVFLDNIEDSSGNPIKDSSGKTIQGQTIYRKARNSVLLDSTGDVIEDGFEQ